MKKSVFLFVFGIISLSMMLGGCFDGDAIHQPFSSDEISLESSFASEESIISIIESESSEELLSPSNDIESSEDKESISEESSFSEALNTYLITWKNEDGSVIKVDEVNEGEVPVYQGNLPTKNGNAQYSYRFLKWEPEIKEAYEEATYIATYEEVINVYNVTWKNDNGEILLKEEYEYGEIPIYKGIVEKDSNAEYTYTFDKWLPEIKEVSGDITYTASYIEKKNTYTVTWKNDNGEVLEIENYEYGELPIYKKDNPIKEDEEYYYSFLSWSPKIQEVSGNTTYEAVFTKENMANISFDLDGGTSSTTLLPKVVTTLSNNDFVFDVNKEGYRFKGWSYNEIQVFDADGKMINFVPLKKNMTFKAMFAEEGSISFVAGGQYIEGIASIKGSGTHLINSDVTLSISLKEGYVFTGWYIGNTLLSKESTYVYHVDSIDDVTIKVGLDYASYSLNVYSTNSDLGLIRVNGNDLQDSYTDLSYKYKSFLFFSAEKVDERDFIGWYDEDDNLVSSDEFFIYHMPNKDLSLYAKWDSSNPTLFTYEVKDNGINITGINDKTVKSINVPSYYIIDNQKINVTEISLGAFSGCSSLEEISLPFVGKKEYFGEDGEGYNFGYIFGKEEYTNSTRTPQNYVTPGKILSDFDYLSTTIYYVPTSLKTVTIRGGNRVAIYAFDSCTNIVNLTFNEGLFRIDEYALKNMANLVNLSLPSSLKVVGMRALNSPYAPNSKLVFKTYNYCNYLGNKDNPYLVLLNAYDKEQVSYDIHPDCRILCSSAFANCTNLSDISISDEITSIGNSLFYNCSSLKMSTFELPKNIVYIDERGLGLSPRPTYIYRGSLTNWFNIVNRQELVAEYNYNRFKFYLDDSEIETSEIIIPSSMKEVPNYAFDGFKNISKVVLEEGVEIIGDYAFRGLNIQDDIFIPASIRKIGKEAFSSNQFSVLSFANNSKLEEIGVEAFSNTSITSLTIPNDTVKLCAGAFSNCYALSEIIFPLTYQNKEIPDYCFSGCNISTYILPDFIETLGREAFNGVENLIISKNSNLKKVSLSSFGVHPYDQDPYGNLYYYSSLSSWLNLKGKIGIDVDVHLFDGEDEITSLNIDETISYLNSYAFAHCNNITSISFTSSLEAIYENAFKGCNNLDISYYGNILDYLSIDKSGLDLPIHLYIDSDAETKVLVLPDSITSLDDNSLKNCAYLEEIIIPNSVTSISLGALKGTSSLKKLSLPFVGEKRYTYLEDEVLYPFGYIFGNDSFDNSSTANQYYKVKIAEGDAIINSSSFHFVEKEGYKYNREIYYLPTFLKEVIVSDSIYLPANAFSYCSNIEKVVLKECVTYIDDYAFENSNIANITILSTPTHIGRDILINNSNITFNEYHNGYYLGDDINPYKALIKVKNNIKELVVHDSTLVLAREILGDNLKIEKIVTPFIGSRYYQEDEDNLYPLGYLFYEEDFATCTPQTYYGNNGVLVNKTYYIPTTLKEIILTKQSYISYGMFMNCYYLENITFSSSLTKIDSYAFSSCTNLSTLSFPDSLKEIGSYAFEKCYNLLDIVIPSSLSILGNEVFNDVEDLEFYYYGSLDSYLSIVGKSSLKGDVHLYLEGEEETTSLIIDEDISSLDAYEFAYCSSLEDVVIASSISEISYLAFAYCSSLTSITLPASLNRITNYAFYKTNLKEINYLGSKENWNNIVLESEWNNSVKKVQINYGGENE